MITRSRRLAVEQRPAARYPTSRANTLRPSPRRSRVRETSGQDGAAGPPRENDAGSASCAGLRPAPIIKVSTRVADACLGGRSTVGHVALDHVIGVRIPASQPDFARLRRASSRQASPRQARSPASLEASLLTRSLSPKRRSREGGDPSEPLASCSDLNPECRTCEAENFCNISPSRCSRILEYFRDRG